MPASVVRFYAMLIVKQGLLPYLSIAKSDTIPVSKVLSDTISVSIVQSTQLLNGHLALVRQCLELVRYMLPAALEDPLGD